MNATVIPDPVNEKVSAPRDALGRPMRDLRISLLDRCNFRCPYCMPESEFNADYQFLRKPQLLTHAEILRIAKVAVSLGVTKLRLTGGEPLLDKNVPALVQSLSELDGVEDLALTTNGFQLADHAAALAAAGCGGFGEALQDRQHERQCQPDKIGKRTLQQQTTARADVGL